MWVKCKECSLQPFYTYSKLKLLNFWRHFCCCLQLFCNFPFVDLLLLLLLLWCFFFILFLQLVNSVFKCNGKSILSFFSVNIAFTLDCDKNWPQGIICTGSTYVRSSHWDVQWKYGLIQQTNKKKKTMKKQQIDASSKKTGFFLLFVSNDPYWSDLSVRTTISNRVLYVKVLHLKL